MFFTETKEIPSSKSWLFSPSCLASELSISCWAGASQLFGQLFPPGFCKCHRWLTTERDFQFLICKSYSFPKYWLWWQWRWRKFRYFSGQWRGLSVDSPSHATTTEECQRETINQNHQNHSACAKYSFLRKGKHHKHSLSRKTTSSSSDNKDHIWISNAVVVRMLNLWLSVDDPIASDRAVAVHHPAQVVPAVEQVKW